MPRLGLIFPHLVIADGCNGGCGLGAVRRPFRPHMPPFLTPGSSIVVSVQNTDVDIGLRRTKRLQIKGAPPCQRING
jgi:hypothetical protein